MTTNANSGPFLDGGPAFPTDELHDSVNWCGGFRHLPGSQGMSLRDYFAVHADEWDLSHQAEVIRSNQLKNNEPGVLPDDWRIKARYMHADAMLKERSK